MHTLVCSEVMGRKRWGLGGGEEEIWGEIMGRKRCGVIRGWWIEGEWA